MDRRKTLMPNLQKKFTCSLIIFISNFFNKLFSSLFLPNQLYVPIINNQYFLNKLINT